MLNKRKIYQRLDHLRDILGELSELKVSSVEELQDPQNFQKRRAIERCLYLAIQDVLDVGSHIISTLTLGMPESYEEIITTLGQENIIPSGFAKSIKRMAGFRNILEHEYLKLDLAKVFENLQRLEDFEKFAKYINEFVERESIN